MDEKRNYFEIDMVAIGANIQKHRKLAGFTQEKLAERLGYSASNLQRIEKGESCPSFKLAIWLANEFNVGLDRLFLSAVNNKTDYYVSELVRLLEPCSPEKKEKVLRLIKVMLEVMEEENT